MSFPGCLIVEHSDHWSIVVGSQTDSVPIGASPEELATCVNVMVNQSGLKNPSCVLAPSSQSCFFTSLRPGVEIDVRDSSALTYELEDHIPVDAESMVADFVVVPSSDETKTISAVAIEVHRWRRIADALETAGIAVHSITPAACLAARTLARGRNLPDTIELVLIDAQDCDVMTIRAETVLAWKRTRLDLKLLQRHTALDGNSPDQTISVGADAAQRELLLQWNPQIESVEGSRESLVQNGAELSLSKHSDRWFNLRRDQLSPSDPMYAIRLPLRAAAFAAMAFLMAVALGGWWRTRRIENEITRVHQQQRKIFQDAFPDVRVPGAILRRVRSEHTRAMSVRGGGTFRVDVPQSAPIVLRELLAALPTDVRVHFNSIAILSGEVDLDFQVRDTVDAGELAEALSAAGFQVDPPQTTQKDSRTYNSTLKAKWIGRADPGTDSEASHRDPLITKVTG